MHLPKGKVGYMLESQAANVVPYIVAILKDARAKTGLQSRCCEIIVRALTWELQELRLALQPREASG